MTALRVDHVSKHFGRREVLKDVSFEIAPGELVGIEGENGAGKSTLLKILVGVLRPSAGTVALRGSLGYCPQEPQLFEALTVAENFELFATAYGLPRERWDGAMEILARTLRFEPYVARRVTELSGGTKQKLNLSLALLHRPDVVVLDEPYTGFDWETYMCFWDITAKLRAEGRCVVVVSHMLHERANFDRVHTLVEGSLRCA